MNILFRSVAGVVFVMLLMAALAGAPELFAQTGEVGREERNSRQSEIGPGPWTLDAGDYRIKVSKVVPNLDRPWGMAFLPDGSMLITETAGRLRIVKNGVLDPTPIEGVPKVMFKDFDGLHDVSLHPKFAENRLLYLSYSKTSPTDQGGMPALARARYEGGYELKDVKDIFVGKGTSPRAQLQSLMPRLAWGKDGTLYMSSATPNQDRFQAQDPTSHRGKILRFKDDGTAPADNPLIGKTLYGLPYQPEIYTMGHRDGLGIAVHPDTGVVWEVENGAQGGDELNILQPGKNYGWPLVSLGREYSGDPIPQFGEGIEQPFVFWGPSIAPSSIMIYSGDKFPKWKGHAFVSALRGARVANLRFNDKGLPVQSSGLSSFFLYELKQRLRQVAQGPDGFLYVLTDYAKNGALLRIEPAGEAASSARR